MIPKYAPADLGLPSSAPQSEMVKQDIFDHVLGMIFWGFWTKFVHRALGLTQLDQLLAAG